MKKILLIFVLLSLVALGCKQTSLFSGNPAGCDPACINCPDNPQALPIISRDLIEVSGIEISSKAPGLIFAHNDSGRPDSLYVLDRRGRLRGVFGLFGDANVDWEDIAIGPCARDLREKECIYIADIGNNRHKRERFQIYKIPMDVLPIEQMSKPGNVISREIGPSELNIIDFCYYENGACLPQKKTPNAEALLVHPITAEIFVITKEGGRGGSGIARVFRIDPQPGQDSAQAVLQAQWEIGEAMGSRVTGADIDMAGKSIFVLLYNGIYKLPIGALQTSGPIDALGEKFACIFNDSRFFQFEALALRPLPGVDAVTIVSEQQDSMPQYLYSIPPQQ